jgi:hypothetical protein
MAASRKAKKKAGSAKKRARAKTVAGKPKAARGGSDDASESLRASAKSFAAKLLR